MRDFDYIREMLDEQRFGYARSISDELAETVRANYFPQTSEIETIADMARAASLTYDNFAAHSIAEAEQRRQMLATSIGIAEYPAIADYAERTLAVCGIDMNSLRGASEWSSHSPLAAMPNVLSDFASMESLAQKSIGASHSIRDRVLADLVEADTHRARAFALVCPTSILDQETERSIMAIADAIDLSRLTANTLASAEASGLSSSFETWLHAATARPNIALALLDRNWDQLYVSVAEQVAEALGTYQSFMTAFGLTDSPVWEALQEARRVAEWPSHYSSEADQEVDADADADAEIDDADARADSGDATEVAPRSLNDIDSDSFYLLANVTIQFAVVSLKLQRLVGVVPDLPFSPEQSPLGDSALFQLAHALVKFSANHIEHAGRLTPLVARVLQGLSQMRPSLDPRNEGQFPDLLQLIDDLDDLSDLLSRSPR